MIPRMSFRAKHLQPNIASSHAQNDGHSERICCSIATIVASIPRRFLQGEPTSVVVVATCQLTDAAGVLHCRNRRLLQDAAPEGSRCMEG